MGKKCVEIPFHKETKKAMWDPIIYDYKTAPNISVQLQRFPNKG